MELLRLFAGYAIVHSWLVHDNADDDSTPHATLLSFDIHDIKSQPTVASGNTAITVTSPVAVAAMISSSVDSSNTITSISDPVRINSNVRLSNGNHESKWCNYSASLTTARYAPSMTRVDDDIIFAGGCTHGFVPMAHVESINIVNRSKRTLSSMIMARGTAVACTLVIHGIPHIMVAGGFDHKFQSLNTAEVLPLSSPALSSLSSSLCDGKWRSISPMLYHRHQSTMISYDNDNDAMIFGGFTNDGITSSVERYNGTTNSWTRCCDMPSARCMATAIVIAHGILLIGTPFIC